MNNDLDFIRELRPPMPHPTAEVVQQEREHLMKFIQTNQPTRNPRRTAVIAAGIGVSILALGGVAAAAGLIPESITNRFTALEQRDGEIDIDNDKVVMVASAVDGTNAVELWVAPTADGDRECEYVRSSWQQSNGEGIAENGPVGCEQLLRPWADPNFQLAGPSSYLASLDVFAIGSDADGYVATAISGAAHPDVATLIVDLRDRKKLSVDVTSPDGWFATVVSGDATAADALGLPSNPAVHVTLVDDTGRTLAELDDWSRFQAQPIPDSEAD